MVSKRSGNKLHVPGPGRRACIEPIVRWNKGTNAPRKESLLFEPQAMSRPQMLKTQKNLAFSCYLDGLPSNAFDAKLKTYH
jgi:hypothetical protein